MKRILMVCLLLIVPGCVDPVIPAELQGVFDDPTTFSETADVVHEGSLEGLQGCWGSYFKTDDGLEVYAQFVEFGEETWETMYYWSVYGAALVFVEEGTYSVVDESTVDVVIERSWSPDRTTGELVPDEDMEYPETRHYRIALEGDRMRFSMFQDATDEDDADADEDDDDESDQYDGTFWRFAECP